MFKLFLLVTLAICLKALEQDDLSLLISSEDQVLSVDDLVLVQDIHTHLIMVSEGRRGLNASIAHGQHRAELEQITEYGQELERATKQYFDAEKNGASSAELDKLRQELKQIEQAIDTLFSELKEDDDLFVRFFVDLNIRELIVTLDEEVQDLQRKHVVLPKQVSVWVQTLKDTERSINYDLSQAEFNKIFEQIQTTVQDILDGIQEKDADFNVYSKPILTFQQLVTQEKDLLARRSQWKVQDRQAYADYLQTQITTIQGTIEQIETMNYYFASEFINLTLILNEVAFKIFQQQVDN